MPNLDQRDIMLYAEIVQTYFKKRHDKYEFGLSQNQIAKILELPTPCGDYQFKDIFSVDRIEVDEGKTTYTLVQRVNVID